MQKLSPPKMQTTPASSNFLAIGYYAPVLYGVDIAN
jgi:hypothetical protein